MSVPFKMYNYLFAFVSVQFHVTLMWPRLNHWDRTLNVTVETSRYSLGDGRVVNVLPSKRIDIEVVNHQ